MYSTPYFAARVVVYGILPGYLVNLIANSPIYALHP